MTREEAAAQAAQALSVMMHLAVELDRVGGGSMYDVGMIVDEEARAKLDLAAALLVLTAPPPVASYVCICNQDFLSREDLTEHLEIVRRWPAGYHASPAAPPETRR